MKDINEIKLGGVLAAAPEINRRDAVALGHFNLLSMTTRKREKYENTFKIIVAGNTADLCGGLEEGDRVLIRGQLSMHKYRAKISRKECFDTYVYAGSVQKIEGGNDG